jgi:hypothetical protein
LFIVFISFLGSFLRGDPDTVIPNWWNLSFREGGKKKKEADASTNNLWLIEHQDTTHGGKIRFKQPLRLKHIPSGQYLVAQSDKGIFSLRVSGLCACMFVLLFRCLFVFISFVCF